MIDALTFENINPECIRVCQNNQRIGEFVRNDDGFFVFFFDVNPVGNGYLSEEFLRALTEHLEMANRPWRLE